MLTSRPFSADKVSFAEGGELRFLSFLTPTGTVFCMTQDMGNGGRFIHNALLEMFLELPIPAERVQSGMHKALFEAFQAQQA